MATQTSPGNPLPFFPRENALYISDFSFLAHLLTNLFATKLGKCARINKARDACAAVFRENEKAMNIDTTTTTTTRTSRTRMTGEEEARAERLPKGGNFCRTPSTRCSRYLTLQSNYRLTFRDIIKLSLLSALSLALPSLLYLSCCSRAFRRRAAAAGPMRNFSRPPCRSGGFYLASLDIIEGENLLEGQI